MKKIILICPGDIAYYPGKIGDVIVVSSVANYLKKLNYNVHFITNKLMKETLETTYDFSFSTFLDEENTQFKKEDLILSLNAEFIFILRPFFNKFADIWEKQLWDYGITKEIIFRIGDLNSFSMNGPHIIDQILNKIIKFLNKERQIEKIYPILDISKVKTGFEFDYVILPFAGDQRKWITNEIIIKIINKLKGIIVILGTELEFEKLKSFKKDIESKYSNVKFISKSINEISLICSKSKEIFTADNGLMWCAVSGLNWLIINKKISQQEVPKIKVFIGKEITQNMLPTSSVWKPILIYKNKVEIINENQKLNLKKIRF